MKSINKLQAKDFTKWIAAQVRQFGPATEIASVQFSAVEMWLKELGFADVVLISGGEIEIDGSQTYSTWGDISLYMFDEDGMMELAASRWLEIARYQQPEDYLIAR
jgi:hypothetical protein